MPFGEGRTSPAKAWSSREWGKNRTGRLCRLCEYGKERSRAVPAFGRGTGGTDGRRPTKVIRRKAYVEALP